MNGFRLKCIIAAIVERLGLNNVCLEMLNKKYANNYIRVINYHFSPSNLSKELEKQVHWLSERFEDCNKEKLILFLKGDYRFVTKPGIIITFDDGYEENYLVANDILTQNKMTGWYMVSAGLLGKKNYSVDGAIHDYMDKTELLELKAMGAEIGCHTFSHHRMNVSDDDVLLEKEICDSKRLLSEALDEEIDIFCWCGGEEHTYTKAAANKVKNADYKIAFMTNSAPILPGQNPLQLDRTNIEAAWPLSLVKFQVSGLMDFRFKKKRERVHAITE